MVGAHKRPSKSAATTSWNHTSARPIHPLPTLRNETYTMERTGHSKKTLLPLMSSPACIGCRVFYVEERARHPGKVQVLCMVSSFTVLGVMGNTFVV